MTKVEWKNTDFIGDIIACLPDLGKSLQATTFYRPPDANPNGFALSMFNNFPYDYEDTTWQVKFSLIPQLDQWFTGIKGRKYPPTTGSEDEAYKIFKEYDGVSFRIRQLFSITAFLAMMGQYIPYGKVALDILSQKEWGEIINTAANTGLLFLGEKSPSSASLLNIFGNGKIDLEKNWDDSYSRDVKQYRYYNPDDLPLSYWKQIFSSLKNMINKDDPLLLSLLSYAREKDNDELRSEILRLALDLDLYTPFTVTGFIRFCKLPGHDFNYLQKAVKNAYLSSNFPDLVKDIDDRNQNYMKRYKEEL